MEILSPQYPKSDLLKGCGVEYINKMPLEVAV